jgi:transcription antitermination factor NusG
MAKRKGGKGKGQGGQKISRATPGAAAFQVGQRVKVLAGDYGNSAGTVASCVGDKADVLLDSSPADPVWFKLDNLAAV